MKRLMKVYGDERCFYNQNVVPFFLIGQKFALMEQKVTLASVLRRFKVTALDKPEDVPLLCELILRPRDEIRLRLNLKQ